MAKIRAKLTVSVDREVLEKAKEMAKVRNIPLSRLIDCFLKFIADPEVYCFKCGEKFHVNDAKICPKCGWMICPECKACGCKLSDDAVSVAFHMRRVYEDLLLGRLKT